MPTNVHVTGLREFQLAATAFGIASKKGLQKELRALAEPVAVDIRRLAVGRGFSPSTVSGIRAGSSRGIPVVRQTRRKTTGTQPHYGHQQMVQAFEPGLEQNEPMIFRGVEEFVDRLAEKFEQGGVL